MYSTTEKNTVLPISLSPSGPGSEPPITVCALFSQTAHKYAEKDALFIMRGGEPLCFSWSEYFENSVAFAKSMVGVGVVERAGVAIMGSNSPEWLFACMGGMMSNCVVTGMYTTNSPDACAY